MESIKLNMKTIINAYILILLIIIASSGCKSTKSLQLKRHGLIGQINDCTYIMFLRKKGSGIIYEITNEYSKEESFTWKYYRGVVYFKNTTTEITRGYVNPTPILPDYGLYGNGGHMLIRTDNLDYLLYNQKIADFRLWDRQRYIPYLQKSGLENKLINKSFGDSATIHRKLEKAKEIHAKLK